MRTSGDTAAEAEFVAVAINGTYHLDRRTRYPDGEGVVSCDRCRRHDIRGFLAHNETDLCLPCVTAVLGLIDLDAMHPLPLLEVTASAQPPAEASAQSRAEAAAWTEHGAMVQDAKAKAAALAEAAARKKAVETAESAPIPGSVAGYAVPVDAAWGSSAGAISFGGAKRHSRVGLMFTPKTPKELAEERRAADIALSRKMAEIDRGGGGLTRMMQMSFPTDAELAKRAADRKAADRRAAEERKACRTLPGATPTPEPAAAPAPTPPPTKPHRVPVTLPAEPTPAEFVDPFALTFMAQDMMS